MTPFAKKCTSFEAHVLLPYVYSCYIISQYMCVKIA